MTEMTTPTYRVRAVHCDHRASDEEVYAALKRATEPLEKAWARLCAARRIVIKFNQDWPAENLAMFDGQYQQLVSERVARATLRLLRERTRADLFCADVSWFQAYAHKLADARPGTTTTLAPVLREFDAAYVDGNAGPLRMCAVPGGGLMFRQYALSQHVAEADALVSVQKMKNHGFMGITLCLKNLFGLMPTEQAPLEQVRPGVVSPPPYRRPRHYFHHLVRMPYVLADLGRILDPALNVLDALVSQAGREWQGGEPRVTNALIAGDQVIATDACAASLMGHDPQADWPTPPFHRDRNALRVAAEAGFGTVDLEQIDFRSEVASPLGAFYAQITDPMAMVASWRRTTAEQALYYRELVDGHRQEFIDRYAGEYILLQEGEVRWHDQSGALRGSRRHLSGRNPEQAMWLKYVDPEEAEGEQYAVYERALEQVKQAQSLL